MTIALIVIAVVVVLLVVGVYLFNRLVRLRNEVDTGWSNIDVQLKRRNDLIPNLDRDGQGLRGARARRVRGGHERAGRHGAARRRPAEAGAADTLLGQAIGRLFAVAEAYPDLKASENFRQLQAELTDTEDKIAAARRYYNATVQRVQHRDPDVPVAPVRGAVRVPARASSSPPSRTSGHRWP